MTDSKNMKTREEIIKQIEYIKSRIVDNIEASKVEMDRVSKAIADYANRPEYVAQWIDSWMSGIQQYEQENKEFREQLRVLNWVLGE